MAVRKCRKCGGSTSTEMKRCQRCGALLKFGELILVGGLILLAIGAIVAAWISTRTPATAADGNPDVPGPPEEPSISSEAMARADWIIKGETVEVASLHRWFGIIDRILSGTIKPGTGSAALEPGAVLNLAEVVNKLAASWGELPLELTYRAWCQRMGRVSYENFPALATACRTKKGADLYRSIVALGQ